ncbi:MAG: hypothetical protein IPN88_09060 [Bacteroidetes bacterium]|nr:hypothetical protein [Bacteroidota bacterium]
MKSQIASRIYDISTIDTETQLSENLIQNDVPLSILNATHGNYEEF